MQNRPGGVALCEKESTHDSGLKEVVVVVIGHSFRYRSVYLDVLA